MILNNFIPENLISTIGWTILHSFWQGLIVALILTLLLLVLNKSSAKLRATISYAALIVILAASAKTFTDIYTSPEIPYSFTVTNQNTLTINESVLFEPKQNREIKTEEDQHIFADIFYPVRNLLNRHLNIIVTIWFAGMLFITLRLMGGLVYSQRIKHHQVFAVSDQWNKLIQSLASKIRISKPIQLFESAIVKFPMIIGHFRPVVLIPLGTLTGLPLDQIEAIIAHELAHIKRSDYLLNIFQSFIEVVFFFNPAVWWISSNIRREREYSCDDLAISNCGSSLTLANALINVQQRGIATPEFAMAAIGNQNSLLTRIKRMSNYNNNSAANYLKFTAAVIFLVSFTTIAFFACSSTNGTDNGESVNKAQFVMAADEPTIIDAQSLPDEPATIMVPEELDDMSLDNEGRKKYSFYDHEDGEEVHWKVILEDGEIVELYKDGKKISEDKIDSYKDYVFEKLEEIREGLHDLKWDMKKLKKDLHKLKFDFHFDGEELEDLELEFDSEEFRKEMEKLHDELEKLHDLEFHFDFDEKHFKWENELDTHTFHWDSEKFKKKMKKLDEKLKDMKFDFHFDFDMDNFHIEMDSLKKNMKNLKINMKGLKVEMKKLEGFLDEMKDELVKDGYLEDDDEHFDLEFNENELTVNGKELPNELKEKYREIYKKHFGKEIDDEIIINK